MNYERLKESAASEASESLLAITDSEMQKCKLLRSFSVLLRFLICYSRESREMTMLCI